MNLSDVSYVDKEFHNAIYPRCNPELSDVLLTKDGANTGNVTLNTISTPFSLLSSVALIKPNRQRLLPAFLTYYLQSPEGLQNITGQMTGTAIKRIILKDLKQAQIPLPPLEEQERIVAILDNTFKQIENEYTISKASIRKLHECKLAAISEAFTRCKSSYPNFRLGDVAKTSSGGTPLKSEKAFYMGGSIPWVLSGEVNARTITSAKNFITPAGLANSSAKLFPANTVLVAMYGATAGQVSVLKFEASTNQAVCGIYPSERWNPDFLYYLFLTEKKRLVSQATGNAQPNISQTKIREIMVPDVPFSEQASIVAELERTSELISKAVDMYEAKLSTLAALKQSLLHAAFSGNL